MSLKEYGTLLQEIGSGTNTGNTVDSIKVDHKLILSLDEKVETIIRQTTQIILKYGRHIIISFRILSIATSISLLLWGTSKLIEARRSNNKRNNDNNN